MAAGSGSPASSSAVALLAFCALARAAAAAAPTKAEYCADFRAARDAPSAADWTGVLVDLFSPDDAACDASRRYVDLAPDGLTLQVSASGTDANCSQTWGRRFNATTTVDPTLAPTSNASVRTTSFISKVPPGSPLYTDAQAGALDFTLVVGAALGARVIKWNGVYDGQGGDVGGETMPPSDCDNFWLYVDAAPRAEASLASVLRSAGRLFAGEQR